MKKFIVEVELVEGFGGCQGCFFENEDVCPCLDCGPDTGNEIFRLESCEESKNESKDR